MSRAGGKREKCLVGEQVKLTLERDREKKKRPTTRASEKKWPGRAKSRKHARGREKERKGEKRECSSRRNATREKHLCYPGETAGETQTGGCLLPPLAERKRKSGQSPRGGSSISSFPCPREKQSSDNCGRRARPIRTLYIYTHMRRALSFEQVERRVTGAVVVFSCEPGLFISTTGACSGLTWRWPASPRTRAHVLSRIWERKIERAQQLDGDV